MADQKISQFTRLSSLDGKEEIPVAKGGKNYSFLSGLLAKQEDLDKTNENVTSLQEEVNKLKYGVGYAVSGYKEDDLDPVPYVSLGDVSFLEKGWDFYLIDTTQNTGEEVVPVGKLKRNNLLRFEDGSFAPTVGITEAMRAECDVELYLDAGHQQKYCDAGAFNAETFYNEHGMAKLYNLQGNEVRVLRPWETVETKYTIVKGWMDEAYFIDKVKGNSGIEWSGFLKEKTVWDGVEITDDNRLVPVGISPCPITTVGGKARNFFYLYEGETNCKSSNGQANLCTLFLNDRTYPRTNDVNQNSNRTYARSNNPNVNQSYPFAEGGYRAYNAFITCQEVIYKTKYLHNNALFSSGISSNDTCNNETDWKNNGGVRYKLSSSGEWKYGTWGSSGDVYYSATQQRTNWSIMANQENPKEQCMESQMAASFAVETGVAEKANFEFYGSVYWYVNIPNVKGLNDGEMNCKVFKQMSQTFAAYDSAGEVKDWDIEVILRFSLFDGLSLSGDIFAYWGGGVEVVGTCKYLQTVQRDGNPVEFYVENDQRKWHNDNTVSKNDLGSFDWESTYKKIGESENISDGYSLKRQKETPYSVLRGGSLSTGECFYQLGNNYWSNVLDQRARIGLRSRGHAYIGSCSPRYLYAYFVASYSHRLYGGSAQVLLKRS
jgi:hypothetical protein